MGIQGLNSTNVYNLPVLHKICACQDVAESNSAC